VALVGGDTLLAKEIRELLEATGAQTHIQLIAGVADGSTLLTAEEEDVLVLEPLTAESLIGASVAILAGSPAASRKAHKIAPPELKLIDLTGALEDRPHARLRAPSAEPLPPSGGEDSVQVIAHAGASAIAGFLAALAKAGKLRRSIIHVFEPASERGKKGLEELQQQTVAVLSFKKLPQEVFDAQVAFNMVARYGEDALESLESVEERLERHLASLLSAWPGIPMPSLRMIQAPVFHGYSFSVWAEFEEAVKVPAFEKALEAAELDVRREEPPNIIGVAGQSGLSVGAIEADRNNPRACWFWVAADNLRLAAENAVAVAKELL
jgi:aspartate-semialdehyde dehydrogenase